MYILNVTRETDSDAKYGIRKSLLPTIDKLRERGHQVEIFDQNKAKTVFSGRFELLLEKLYLIFMRRYFRDNNQLPWLIYSERIKIGRLAAKYAAKNVVTHVHCHDPLLAYAYWFFSRLYRSTHCFGYKLTAFGRFVKPRLGIDLDKESLLFLQKLEKKAEQKAKWVFLTTKSGMEKMRQDLEKEEIPAKWYLVSNPVAISLEDRFSARQKLGIKVGEKLLIAAGQLIPMKRFDLLIQSVALIPELNRPVIVILGDGPEKQNLYRLAERYNIADFEIRVSQQIGTYLSAADLYVSTSSTESFGMANCEALMAGLPSVCTNVGAVAELLKNGAILTSDDPEEIATSIIKVLENNKIRDELISYSREVTSNWPTPSDIADKFERILSNCK